MQSAKANTCRNEQRLLAALSLEEPDEVPSFCQSLMAKICADYDEQYGDDLDEETVLLTPTGDFTLYKAFGYSSHWIPAPRGVLAVDDAWRDEVVRVNSELKAGPNPNYSLGLNGSIRGTGLVHGFPMGWFVEPYLTTPSRLRKFLDWVEYEPPGPKEVENFREARLLSFGKEFVPVPATNMVIEPGLQTIGLSLIARLVRKDPDLLREYFSFLAEQSRVRVKAAIDAGYRVFVIADDCAFKDGPMLNPKQYREFVVPHFQPVTELVHEHGGKIFFHTDGWIHPILDDVVAMGMDGINPLEVQSGMRLGDVKRTHGEKLCLVGNVDTAGTLPFGTPDDARAEVRQCFREAGREGYIFAACGSLHHEVKLENALAMMDEWRRVNAGPSLS
ncbi:MAG: uroporphyrinogen decarboxylase family protein [Promethearchaeota archaeon]